MQIILKFTLRALQELPIGSEAYFFLDCGTKARAALIERTDETVTFRQTFPVEATYNDKTMRTERALSSFFLLCSRPNNNLSSRHVKTAIKTGVAPFPLELSNALNCTKKQACIALCWIGKHPTLNKDGFDLNGLEDVESSDTPDSYEPSLCVTMEKENGIKTRYYTGDLNALYDQCASNPQVLSYTFESARQSA